MQQIFALFLRNAKKVANNLVVPDQGSAFNEAAQKVRWFLLPTEAQKHLSGSTWSKLKKASAGKLHLRASSGDATSPSALAYKSKKGRGDKKEEKSVTIIDADDEVNHNDCYNPFGTLTGDAILPIPSLRDETRRRGHRVAWLTRQVASENDLGIWSNYI